MEKRKCMLKGDTVVVISGKDKGKKESGISCPSKGWQSYSRRRKYEYEAQNHHRRFNRAGIIHQESPYFHQKLCYGVTNVKKV